MTLDAISAPEACAADRREDMGMRPRLAQGRSGRSAVALLAALALWLQILVPAIGTTTHLVLSLDHHAGHHAEIDHAHHGAAEATPAAPAQEHGGHHGSHWGLCCIIGGGKLGTGFAPPPSIHALPTGHSHVAAIDHGPVQHVLPSARRSILPVGARAPPRFA
jgi:hypothetical protein